MGEVGPLGEVPKGRIPEKPAGEVSKLPPEPSKTSEIEKKTISDEQKKEVNKKHGISPEMKGQAIIDAAKRLGLG